MRVPEDDVTFAQRVAYVSAEVAAAEEDCVSVFLAEATGVDPQPHGERMYDRLEAMSSRDLALAVVVMFHDRAHQQAERLWSQLWESAPKDVKA